MHVAFGRVVYAANRGFSRITRRLRGKEGYGGHKLTSDCLNARRFGYAANRGLSRITQMTRIIGGVMVVGGNCLKRDLWDLLIYGVEGMGSCLKRDL